MGKMKKNDKFHTFLKWTVFLAYIAALVYFMFFAEILGRTDFSARYRYNLVPLKEIKRFLNNASTLGWVAVFANIGGNILAFMPFGFCLPLVSRHHFKFVATTLYTFGLSLTIELIQLVSKVGSCDVDDLILNTLGGILGYIIFYIYVKMFGNNKRKKSR